MYIYYCFGNIKKTSLGKIIEPEICYCFNFAAFERNTALTLIRADMWFKRSDPLFKLRFPKKNMRNKFFKLHKAQNILILHNLFAYKIITNKTEYINKVKKIMLKKDTDM